MEGLPPLFFSVGSSCPERSSEASSFETWDGVTSSSSLSPFEDFLAEGDFSFEGFLVEGDFLEEPLFGDSSSSSSSIDSSGPSS